MLDFTSLGNVLLLLHEWANDGLCLLTPRMFIASLWVITLQCKSLSALNSTFRHPDFKNSSNNHIWSHLELPALHTLKNSLESCYQWMIEGPHRFKTPSSSSPSLPWLSDPGIQCSCAWKWAQGFPLCRLGHFSTMFYFVQWDVEISFYHVKTNLF